MTIMINNYLSAETYKYKHDNGDITEEGQWYFYNTDKFIEQEILYKSEIDAVALNSDDVELPSHSGLCYIGQGIQIKYNGTRYNIADQSSYQDIIQSWDDVKWYWNKKAFQKYGGTTTVTFDVHVMDKSGNLIPGIQLTATKSVE